jgi:hypothetical protein
VMKAVLGTGVKERASFSKKWKHSYTYKFI